MQEEPFIRSAIDTYLKALSAPDAGQERELEILSISLTGTKALVKAKEQRAAKSETGEPATTSRRVTIGLEKGDAGWVVATYR
jgi:ketosteroid isomerase-like protein